jgi:RNA polymerase sigma factor (sigma-70 family)
MELSELIQRARAGDIAAFTELVRRYQDLAFGYAYAILRDFHLAQDAAQEAFIIAHSGLERLQEPAAFPGWLRGIVRHQCGRLLRKRHVAIVSLEQAGDRALAPSPEAQVEQRDARDQVLAAIEALPDGQRAVAILFYIKEYSQAEVAAFLGLPVTTVNNRLHAARKQLKRRMLPMVKDSFNEHALPADFAEQIGRIVRVQGPVIDARFASGKLPALFSRLTIADKPRTFELTAEVAQHIGDGLVRCIAAAPGGKVSPGMEVVDTGAPIQAAITSEMLQQAISILRDAAKAQRPEAPELLETGIKVIDLLCPYLKGGMIGLFGDVRSGKLAVIEELLHNIAPHQAGIALIAFAHAGDEAATWAGHPPPASAGAVQAIYVPADNPSDPAFVSAFADLDAAIYLNRDLGAGGIWPAVDPLRSTSRALDPAIVGQEHYDAALAVRQILRRAEEPAEGAGEDLAEERQLIARARKIRRFCSQPFFIAEPYTKRPGQFVPRAETIKAFKALLAGEYDHLPEEAFLMCGTIEQVIANAG